PFLFHQQSWWLSLAQATQRKEAAAQKSAQLPLLWRDNLNARRVRFAHLQRKDHFIFASGENLRIFPACFFTGGRYQKWHFFR
uniref:hypothetical protein n=1 Tax=Faecalibacterium sp. TaxID=1971605 RepID=UPI004024BC29